MQDNLFAERLTQALRDNDMTLTQLAELSGYTKQHLSGVKNGHRALNEKLIKKISSILNKQPFYFTLSGASENDVRNFVALPFHIPGEKKMHVTPVLSSVTMSKEWANIYTTGIDNLSVVRASDSTMTPTIPFGANVVLDEGDCEIVTNRIYLIDFSGNKMIRRLVCTDSGVFMVADNGGSRVEIHLEEVKILGRCIKQISDL